MEAGGDTADTGSARSMVQKRMANSLRSNQCG